MENKQSKKIFNYRLIPAIASGMVAGIIFIMATEIWLPLVVVLISFTAGVCAVAGIVKKRKRRRRYYLISLCFVAGIIAGLTTATVARNNIESRAVYQENATIEAKIQVGNATDLTGSIKSYRIIVDDITLNGERLEGKAVLYGEQLTGGEFSEGDVIEFVGDITTITTVITTPFKANNFASDIIYEISVNAEESTIIKTGKDLNIFDKIKIAVAQKLAKSVPDDTGRFMYAMLFGESGVIDEEIRNDFSATGTAHLLAVSGLHVGILAGALLWLLSKLKVNKYLRSAIVAICLVFFSALCGFSPSTVRATIMFVLILIAPLTGLCYDRISGLCFAGIILLFVSPYNLFSLGFLMSFLAVLGLILYGARTFAFLRKLRCPEFIASSLSATVSANIMLLPLMIYTFGKTSLVFTLANCIVVPVVGIIFPLYALGLAISFIPYAGWVLTAIGFLFTLIIKVVNYLATVRFFAINLNLTCTMILTWLAIAIIVSPACFINKQVKKIIASGCVIAIISTLGIQNVSLLNTDAKLLCFNDYESGNAIIEDDGKCYLFLTGEITEYKMQLCMQALEDMRVAQLEGVIIYDLSDEEKDIYSQYSEKINAKTIYTNERKFYGENIMPLKVIYAQLDMVCTASYTALKLENTRIFLAGGGINLLEAQGYDIAVSPLLDKKPEGCQYLVSTTAYEANQKDCLPSMFTFWFNNGKILKTNTWRYV